MTPLAGPGSLGLPRRHLTARLGWGCGGAAQPSLGARVPASWDPSSFLCLPLTVLFFLFNRNWWGRTVLGRPEREGGVAPLPVCGHQARGSVGTKQGLSLCPDLGPAGRSACWYGWQSSSCFAVSPLSFLRGALCSGNQGLALATQAGHPRAAADLSTAGIPLAPAVFL